jgi:hypothetical protein
MCIEYLKNYFFVDNEVKKFFLTKIRYRKIFSYLINCFNKDTNYKKENK